MPPPRDSSDQNALAQGIEIIRLISLSDGASLGVTQIAKAMLLSKSTVHRQLQRLGKIGFIEQNRQTLRYSLSAPIYQFVHDIASPFGKDPVIDRLMRETAHRLQCTVYLSMLAGRETYLVAGAGDEGNTTRLGLHGPAFATSSGKVLVSHRPEAEWAHFAPSSSDHPITDFTNQNPECYYKQLREASISGVAWNRRETSTDHVSIAAPVFEPFHTYPRLAVALLVRQDRMMLHDYDQLEKNVRDLAKAISARRGGRRGRR